MSACLTVGGKDDKMFGFDFDNEQKIVQTRGDKDRQGTDFTDHLLNNRVGLLRAKLGA